LPLLQVPNSSESVAPLLPVLESYWRKHWRSEKKAFKRELLQVTT